MSLASNHGAINTDGNTDGNESMNGVSTKLFVGYLLTSELRLHLQQSQLWKLSQLMAMQCPVIECSHQKRSYLGSFLPLPTPLSQIHLLESQLLATVHRECPDLILDSYCAVTFVQAFLG